jgi:hypothetical protein
MRKAKYEVKKEEKEIVDYLIQTDNYLKGLDLQPPPPPRKR